MTFAKEQYSDGLINEMLPLWQMHHAETADAQYGPLEPDIAIYVQLAQVGALRIYTVREDEALIGYQIFMVGYHPHSRNMLTATQDVLFLHPEHRKGLNGYNFVKWCCEELKGEGIQSVTQRISAHNNFGAMLKRIGFELEDLTFSRRLTEV